MLDKLIKARDEKRSLSTFAGVFTPSILTIIGVTLYLRIGWVVGCIGFVPSLLMVVLASSITLITAFSISSIATNMEVKTGGAYYMISRSLGVIPGATIGIAFYFAQALSAPMHILGFAESLRILVPDIPVKLIAIITLIVITFFSFLGVKFVLKIQYLIMFFIGCSFLSYYVGFFYLPVKMPDLSIAINITDFWGVFAVYFPAVTGILAGVSMSGDLKTPQKSIPRGTFAAIFTGFFIYLSLVIVMAFSVNPAELINNELVMITNSRWPFLVLFGLWGATLSSAFGLFLGAPRTMQALARDGIFNKHLGRGFGQQDEPLTALFLTFGLTFIAIAVGTINTLAPVLTMFFLTTYGSLNLASAVETIINNLQFRPMFKTKWQLSFLGAGACFLSMYLINKQSALFAVLAVSLIFFWLKKKDLKQTWGDINKGIWLSLTNLCLQRLKNMKNDPKNWRPNILVFSSNPEKQKELVRAAHWFGHESSIVLACNLIQGKLEENVREIIRREKKTEQFLKEQRINAFVSTSVIENFEKDTAIIVQSAGIGDIRPNTVMFPWQEMDWLQQKHFVAMIRNQFYIGKNTLVLGINSVKPAAAEFLDIWWGGEDRNIELMLLLAHQLKMHPDWPQVKLRVLMALPAQEIKKKEGQLKIFLDAARIETEILIIERQSSIAEHILENSGQSRMTMLGLAYPEKGTEREYYQGLAKYVQMLPLVVFVRNSKRAGVEIV